MIPQLATKRHPKRSPNPRQEIHVFRRQSLAGPQAKMKSSIEIAAYRSLLEKVHIRKETDYRGERAESAQRWSLVISAPFLPSYIEWQSLNIYGQIARTLMFHPILHRPFHYFEMIVKGRIDAFQSALRRRETSPFAREIVKDTLFYT